MPSLPNVLDDFYGRLLVVRPPAPVTFNKAGVNYKSEATHLEYYPREAYREWLAICDAIVASGGDGVFFFESDDERYLDVPGVRIDADGSIYVADSQSPQGHVDELLTGRVFTANGPWVIVAGNQLRALLPNMIAHRKAERSYYVELLQRLATAAGLELEVQDNPHRWEGMADVAAMHDRAVFTYTVSGHYDADVGPKTSRSSLAGVQHAAAFAGLSDQQALFAELVYPHFHGDTVHFALRSSRGYELMHFPQGLWRDGSAQVRRFVGSERIVEISASDAVEHYAANSRQVERGVLVPSTVSEAYLGELRSRHLNVYPIHLAELFGKAGGGPGCATLYLPQSLAVSQGAMLLYSEQRELAHARAERVPEVVKVAPEFFADHRRG